MRPDLRERAQSALETGRKSGGILRHFLTSNQTQSTVEPRYFQGGGRDASRRRTDMMTMSTPVNRVPVTMDLPLDQLFVDPANDPQHPGGYQRDKDDPQFQNLKKRIVGHFDPALLHPLDVSEWDNWQEGTPRYQIYDGYCRSESVKELVTLGQYGNPSLGLKNTIRCNVIRVDREEQARLFVGQTDRRGVQWADKHFARLSYNDPTAVAIEDVFRRLGIKLGKNGDVRAVQACYSTVEIDRTAKNANAALRPDLLEEVLTVAGSAWTPIPGNLGLGLREQYASSDRTMDALALLLSKYDAAEMPRPNVIRALKQHSPAFLVEKAARKTSVHGSNNKGQLAVEILALYNKVNNTKLHKTRIVTTGRARRTGRATAKRRKP